MNMKNLKDHLVPKQYRFKLGETLVKVELKIHRGKLLMIAGGEFRIITITEAKAIKKNLLALAEAKEITDINVISSMRVVKNPANGEVVEQSYAKYGYQDY